VAGHPDAGAGQAGRGHRRRDVLDGQLFRGVDGGAGDIGHIRMHGHTAPCARGATGCLAAVASGAAPVRRLRELGKDVSTIADVQRLVQHDPDAVAEARAAGRLAGEVLTTVVSVLNPEILVLAGEMAQTHGHFVPGLREMIYQRSLPRATRNLRIVTTRLGELASLAGAVELVVDGVFAPAAVDARLAAATGARA
jgi:predicted NBD/HSP70 family sugar kinase